MEYPVIAEKAYEHLASDQRGLLEKAIEVLFSLEAFRTTMTIDDLRSLGPFAPHLRIKGVDRYLSEEGTAALRRIHGVLCQDLNEVSRRESMQVLQTYVEELLGQYLMPTGEELFIEVTNRIRALSSDFVFLAILEGLRFKDLESVTIGSLEVRTPSKKFLDDRHFDENIELKSVYEDSKGDSWITGKVRGSPDRAQERFAVRAKLAVGTLAVCGAVLYPGAIWRTRIREIVGGGSRRRAATVLRWQDGGTNLTSWRGWRDDVDLILSKENIRYLSKECFFNELGAVADVAKTELEHAIVRGLYWYADAHQDPSRVMQYLKLWSCAEIFFATPSRRGATERNARGIAAILAFGGYRIVDANQYSTVKARVRDHYALRSRAIHEGVFDHISRSDVDELSHWVAWIIIAMMSLAGRGYARLAEIEQQAQRLDDLGH